MIFKYAPGLGERSMENMKMSLGNAIFAAFLFILHVTGMTGAAEGYAEQAAYNLADVAHMNELEIRSSNPQWLHEGMQISAYTHSPYYWKKRHLTWALMNEPVVMTKAEVIDAVQTACKKWAEVSSFTFERVSPVEQPDIRIQSVPEGINRHDIQLDHNKLKRKKDRKGVTLQFARLSNSQWAGKNREGGVNFRFAILYQMGRILGLSSSKVPGAVMYISDKESHPGYKLGQDYELTEDDRAGIQAKCKFPPPEATQLSSSSSSSSDSCSFDPPSPTSTFSD